MKKYNADPGNMVSMLGEYSEMMQKYADFADKLDKYDPTGIRDKFEKAMENLSGKSFSQTDFSTAVDLFQSQSRMNSSGTYNASYYTKGDPSNGSLLQQFYPLER